MKISYKKLWKLLIDKDMKKKDLVAKTGISQASLAKMGKNEHVSLDVLLRVCEALSCDFCDIMQAIPNDSKTMEAADGK